MGEEGNRWAVEEPRGKALNCKSLIMAYLRKEYDLMDWNHMSDEEKVGGTNKVDDGVNDSREFEIFSRAVGVSIQG